MSDIAGRKHKGLGRGLNALFEDDADEEYSASASGSDARKRQTLGIEQLRPGAFQPRQTFNEDSLDELAESLKRHGVIQPIIVRAANDAAGLYDIIAGERRWRAAQRAQLHEVPVIIEDFTDLQAMEIALIENLQREDLNPIDEAQGYQKLLDDYDHTQEQLAKALGKSRPHIANMVRLLTLPDGVQNYVRGGQLSAGHARTLVTAKEPEKLAKQIISKNLSVRQAESLAAQENGKAKSGKSSKSAPAKDTDTIALEKEISNLLGMRVNIAPKNAQGSKGQVQIDFRDLDQLDEILKRLSNTASDEKPSVSAGPRLTQ